MPAAPALERDPPSGDAPRPPRAKGRRASLWGGVDGSAPLVRPVRGPKAAAAARAREDADRAAEAARLRAKFAEIDATSLLEESPDQQRRRSGLRGYETRPRPSRPVEMNAAAANIAAGAAPRTLAEALGRPELAAAPTPPAVSAVPSPSPSFGFDGAPTPSAPTPGAAQTSAAEPLPTPRGAAAPTPAPSSRAAAPTPAPMAPTPRGPVALVPVASTPWGGAVPSAPAPTPAPSLVPKPAPAPAPVPAVDPDETSDDAEVVAVGGGAGGDGDSDAPFSEEEEEEGAGPSPGGRVEGAPTLGATPGPGGPCGRGPSLLHPRASLRTSLAPIGGPSRASAGTRASLVAETASAAAAPGRGALRPSLVVPAASAAGGDLGPAAETRRASERLAAGVAGLGLDAVPASTPAPTPAHATFAAAATPCPSAMGSPETAARSSLADPLALLLAECGQGPFDPRAAHGTVASLESAAASFDPAAAAADLPDVSTFLSTHVSLRRGPGGPKCERTGRPIEGLVKIGEGTYGEVFRAPGLATGAAGGVTSRFGGWSSPSRRVVIKIVPVGGSARVNGEVQKSLDEIRAEVAVTKRLSGLRPGADGGDPAPGGVGAGPAPNETRGFARCFAAAVVRGPMPPALLDAWGDFDADPTRGPSENDDPRCAPWAADSNQLFGVILSNDAGVDLERCRLRGIEECRGVLVRVCLALAVAEEACGFEHRDLHWGNVLLQTCSSAGGLTDGDHDGPDVGAGWDGDAPAPLSLPPGGVVSLVDEDVKPFAAAGPALAISASSLAPTSFPGAPEACRLRGVCVVAKPCRVRPTLIDFTLSRLVTRDGAVAFCDLDRDPDLFRGPRGDPQAAAYRAMRRVVHGKSACGSDDGTSDTASQPPPGTSVWALPRPATNAVWMRYLALAVADLAAGTLSKDEARSLRGFARRAPEAAGGGALLWDPFLRAGWDLA